MFCSTKCIILGLYVFSLAYNTHSFVLLTANVEDLKRIAQKFVSDSLADKIARFIIEAADNNLDIDASNNTRNLSEYNDEFDVEKKDNKPDYVGEFRHKSEPKVKQDHIPIKPSSTYTTKAEPKELHYKDNKKTNKKKKQTKSKSKAKKPNKITTEQSSLEYYRSEKIINKLSPNTIVDLEKIHESYDSSQNIKFEGTRKDFDNLDDFDKTEETQVKDDNLESKIHNVEKDVSDATKVKKDTLENASDDLNDSKRVDIHSEEITTPTTELTTAKERNEFDQYFNTNYPKSEVVATSGPVELTKIDKQDSAGTDYE